MAENPGLSAGLTKNGSIVVQSPWLSSSCGKPTPKLFVQSFPRYMQAPAEAQAGGFFTVLRYWLERTENMVRDNWASYRIYLVGNYGIQTGSVGDPCETQ
jgi:hypothetical protein